MMLPSLSMLNFSVVLFRTERSLAPAVEYVAPVSVMTPTADAPFAYVPLTVVEAEAVMPPVSQRAGVETAPPRSM